jgi:hypothetical protein
MSIRTAAAGTVTRLTAGAGLNGGTITSAGTVSLAPIASVHILANAAGTSAVPAAVPIGGGLSFNSGTLTSPSGTVTSVTAGTGLAGGAITNAGTVSLATRTAGTLMGNPGTAAATPSDITIGAGVTLSTGGTLSATGSGGTVTNVATGTGLTGGPVTNTGTVSLATRTASTLMGNPGTAAATPSDITVGAGLALSTAGTLTASGSGGTVTSVVAGSGLSGGTITATGTVALATIATGDVLANTSGSTAVPVATTVSALIDNAIGSVQGDVLYRSASAWSVLAPGTSGQVLKTGGAAANPAWANSLWNAGTVTTVGTGLTLSSGTITASGGVPVITTLLSPNPASGNLTANGTEQTIASSTSLSVGATFQPVIDLTNLADGDIVIVKTYRQANSSSSLVEESAVSFSNAQSDLVPDLKKTNCTAGLGYKATVQQTARNQSHISMGSAE